MWFLRVGRLTCLSERTVPGSYLCSQFSFNTGAEYNHVVNVDTVPFDRPLSNAPASRSEQLSTAHAPPCVREACEYIAEVARLVCQPSDEVDEGFNEVLSVAYSEFTGDSLQSNRSADSLLPYIILRSYPLSTWP